MFLTMFTTWTLSHSTPVDPKSKPKPRAKPKAPLKKGSAKDADGDANGGGTIVPQSTPTKTLTKRDRSRANESTAEPADGQGTGSLESQNVTSPGSGSHASQQSGDMRRIVAFLTTGQGWCQTTFSKQGAPEGKNVGR